MIHAELCSKYLADRGIDPEVAKKYGVEFVDGEQIASRMNRWDGLKMVSAIVIGDVVRPLRGPVRLPEGEYLEVPEAEKFCEGWRFRARQDFAEAEEGVYAWTDLTGKAGLVRKTKKGELFQEPFYPVKAPVNAKVQKFVVKKGEKRGLYIPEPVVGNRPMLIVEGSTRVLAVLSHLKGETLDVVGLPSCHISEENTETLLELAKNATTIYVVLDGDVVTNPEVARALGHIIYRLDPPKEEGGRRRRRQRAAGGHPHRHPAAA